jgi:hypothetical protein
MGVDSEFIYNSGVRPIPHPLMHRPFIRSLALVAVAVSATAAGAQQIPQNVEVHGFGSWNSGATNNQNLYLGGKWKGSSTNSSAGLNLTGDLGDRVSFTTQLSFDFDGATETELDFAFGEYKLTDALKLRAGQVKQPFGLFTEVMDVGTVRPFLYLPQSLYGPTAAVAEAYRGIGLTGYLDLPAGVSMDYDVYGGGLNRKENEFTLDMYRALQGRKSFDDVGNEVGTEVTDQMYGGRFMFNVLQGVRTGVSGYHSVTGEASAGRGWVSTVGYAAEFARGRTALRSEVFRQWENDHDRENGWYYEGSYRLFGGWQLAGRFDRSSVHLKNPRPTSSSDLAVDIRPPVGQSLLEHRELAGGVNYFFSPNFVMKASVHHTQGNHFAQPTGDGSLIDAYHDAEALYQSTGTVTEVAPRKTTAVLVGAQFSF